jgi:hypothetical protein
MNHEHEARGARDGGTEKDLFAFERRFERRVLYVFHAIMVVAAITAFVRGDWWLLVICIGVLFLNGFIGGTLQKNRHKPFTGLYEFRKQRLFGVDIARGSRCLGFLRRNQIHCRLLTPIRCRCRSTRCK